MMTKKHGEAKSEIMYFRSEVGFLSRNSQFDRNFSIDRQKAACSHDPSCVA